MSTEKYFYLRKLLTVMEIEEEEVKDILNVLHAAEELLREFKIDELKECSNHIIHSAAIYQDKYAINTAIIIYAISKVLERRKFRESKEIETFVEKVLKGLGDLSRALEANNLEDFMRIIKSMMREISLVDRNFSEYLEHVLHKARLKKASKIYEHGLSLGKVAELLGLSKWEVMQYTGKTRIHDREDTKTMSVRDRLKKVEDIFS